MVSLVIRLYNFMIYIAIMYTVKAISKTQHVEVDSTKLAKDMKKIIMALLYIL